MDCVHNPLMPSVLCVVLRCCWAVLCCAGLGVHCAAATGDALRSLLKVADSIVAHCSPRLKVRDTSIIVGCMVCVPDTRDIETAAKVRHTRTKSREA